MSAAFGLLWESRTLRQVAKGYKVRSATLKFIEPTCSLFNDRGNNTLVQLAGWFMSSKGLNKWIVSGNLAADAQIKTVDLKTGEKAQVATATLYVQKPRDREESFTVSLSIWEKSYAWRKLQFLKKGSLIICTGNVEPNPFISSNGNVPRAGLQMTVLDIDLDIIRDDATKDESVDSAFVEGVMAPA